jgi:hypothetical protein
MIKMGMGKHYAYWLELMLQYVLGNARKFFLLITSGVYECAESGVIRHDASAFLERIESEMFYVHCLKNLLNTYKNTKRVIKFVG